MGATPWELIWHAHRLGLALRVEGDQLLVSPAERLPDDLRTHLANNAGAVALLLRANACLQCGSTTWHLALVTDGGRRGCSECVKSKGRRVGALTRAGGGAA